MTNITPNTSVNLIDAEFSKIKDFYTKPEEVSFNCMLLGDMGIGKTYLAKTCRKPVLVHSFDPGGHKTLLQDIAKGDILCDYRYESERAKTPTAFELWNNEMERLAKIGFFKHIGTYFLDSYTSFSRSLLNYILKLEGRAGSIPQQRDYQTLVFRVVDVWNMLATLPCHVVLTGHLDMTRNSVTGIERATIAATPAVQSILPLGADEIWVLQATRSHTGIKRSILLNNDGVYQCRSRLSANGKLGQSEEPDFCKILEKAGFPTTPVEVPK